MGGQAPCFLGADCGTRQGGSSTRQGSVLAVTLRYKPLVCPLEDCLFGLLGLTFSSEGQNNLASFQKAIVSGEKKGI